MIAVVTENQSFKWTEHVPPNTVHCEGDKITCEGDKITWRRVDIVMTENPKDKNLPTSKHPLLLLPKGDEDVALQDSNDCSWNYVRDEVWWYLTTDGTCALPLLCMIFMILPSIVLLAFLVFSGWRLWRFRINNSIETESVLQEYIVFLVFQKGYALPFLPL